MLLTPGIILLLIVKSNLFFIPVTSIGPRFLSLGKTTLFIVVS